MPPMGPPEKILIINTVPQNRLNAIKQIMKFNVNFELLGLYESLLGCYLRQSFKSCQTLSNDTLRSNIGLWVETLRSKISCVIEKLNARDVLNGPL